MLAAQKWKKQSMQCTKMFSKLDHPALRYSALKLTSSSVVGCLVWLYSLVLLRSNVHLFQYSNMSPGSTVIYSFALVGEWDMHLVTGVIATLTLCPRLALQGTAEKPIPCLHQYGRPTTYL